ncbi:MAG: hypothetical protein WBW71_16165 [Bacteroidota bacterium]
MVETLTSFFFMQSIKKERECQGKHVEMSDTLLGESQYVEIFGMVNQKDVRHLPKSNLDQNALAVVTHFE